MHVSTRTLGAGDGNAARAAGQIVAYLARGDGPPPAQVPERDEVPLGAYYADAGIGAGQWLGRGVAAVRPSGAVEVRAFERVLLGQDPATGAQLIGAVGSSGRAAMQATPATPSATGTCWLTVAEVAGELRVSETYVRRLLDRGEQLARQPVAERTTVGQPAADGAATADARDAAAVAEHADARQPVTAQPDLAPKVYLTGCRDPHGNWTVARHEVDRFLATRTAPAVVVGYDVTFSVPKSVSVLWAAVDDGRRGEIEAAVEQAVRAGVEYLEDHGAFVRSKGRRVPSEGIVAASYLHTTSRALEPQLHRHVVIANIGGARGKIQALDGAGIYLHQRAAAALAGAELRAQLTQRLGVEWGPVRNGKADIAGIPADALRAFSTRSAQINNLAAELGNDSLAARQVAAYRTRQPKRPVAAETLTDGWRHRLAAAGFGPKVVPTVLDRQTAPRPLTAQDLATLFERLGFTVTEHQATFDRRDVIEAVADWSGDRLSAREVADVADRWLATEPVIQLGVGDGRRRCAADVIRRADGRTVSARTGAALYTTVQMLELEARVRAAFAAGIGVGAGLVADDLVDHVLAERPTIGDDQTRFVHALVGSGDRVQAAVGPAGTGKTFALDAAAAAWRAAGYRPIGAAVGGTAAEVLGQATGMPSTTVASLLTRLDLADPGRPVLDASTVVVVDEASTLGNRDLDRLVRHVTAAGATLRLVGDTAQHDAVTAGGFWSALVRDHPDRTPRLDELRRQRGDHMEPVRLALTEYRDGHIGDALRRLEQDRRVVEAPTADELLDCLVADWYVDRQRRAVEPERAPSSMVAERHHERHALNERARALLAADGTLHGPSIEVAGQQFRAGDDVIARLQDRDLRPAGGDRASFVRNGTRGTVVAVHPDPGPRAGVTVDFEGRGRVFVPRRFLETEVAPGLVGGLTHSYAVTSYAAQGETYDAARHLATDHSSRAGVYVGLSRGTDDTRLYMVRADGLEANPGGEHGLPSPAPRTEVVDAVVARLQADQPQRLPSQIDPDAAVVTRIAREHTLPELTDAAEGGEPLAARAVAAKIAELRRDACLDPDDRILDRLGERPARGPERQAWDRAVGAIAVYRAYVPGIDDDILGDRPDAPSLASLYDAAAELVARAEPVTSPTPAPEPPAIELAP